jgi:glycosyltransferase involved in cell wall biosynthesis
VRTVSRSSDSSEPLVRNGGGAARRVLILSGFWPPHEGGVERYAEAMADELASRGWEVHAAFSDLGSTDGDAPHVSSGAPVGPAPVLHPYPVSMLAGRLPVPKVWMSAWRHTRRVLAARPVDLVIVMSHHYLANVMLARAVRARETLWINHVSGHIPAGRGPVSWLVHRYEHVLAMLHRRTCTQAAGVSTAAAAWLEHLGVTTTRVLPNAVRPDAIDAEVRRREAASNDVPHADVPHRTFEVASVGRIEPGKGWDSAIGIVRSLAGILPDGLTARLSVAGGGTRLRELERLAGDEPDVRVLGPVAHRQVMALLRAADVLLLPSRYPEGLPTVLLEAGSVALPVVVFPAGGTTDLVVDGVSGVVVGDDAAAVAALHRIATDPAAGWALGTALQQRIVDGFLWPHVVDAMLEDLGFDAGDGEEERDHVA